MPDGTLARFRFVESPVMAPALAAKFPEIKTYLGWGVDDPSATVRFSVTPHGFQAQVLSPRGAVYIDPHLRGDVGLYASYFKRDHRREADGFQCVTPSGDMVSMQSEPAAGEPMRSGNVLRTYRLACAATGEYTQFHGGTVSAGMAAIVAAINRVNGVYELELAIRFELVANNDLIVYTQPNSDPYHNNNGSLMLSQNQSNLDAVIGSANYDVGHVFSTGGGGIASLASVCSPGNKARGVTGLSAPTGDAFYIDYVAHELGHQFGANHTFNGTSGGCGGGNRNAATAYEPGSGSTIMAYAGICGSDNLQMASDPYFHAASFDEITRFITFGGGAACAVVTPTGNSFPVVSAGANQIIPRKTPFTLTAEAFDPDDDELTFCWEERDLGPSVNVIAPDNGSSPLFRSFNPIADASRTFPRLSDILNNTASIGEKLPETGRTLSFRVTVRDNRPDGGGVNTSDMQLTIVPEAGPFEVISPGAGVIWSNVQTVVWTVAGTDSEPIHCDTVNILLSTNGGLSFPIILAAGTENDGIEPVLLPDISTALARIKVEAANNVFFNVSPGNFSIVSHVPGPALVWESVELLSESCGTPNGAVDPGETVTFNFVLRNLGTVATTNLLVTLLETNGVFVPGEPQFYGELPAYGGMAGGSFSFIADGPCGGSITAVLQLQDDSVNLGTLTRAFDVGIKQGAVLEQANPGTINILDFSPASPYPSTIQVSGVTGAVVSVRATLHGISHTYPDDIDILLVAPGGESVMLMSDVGGGTAINDVTLTFDDAAAQSLPDSAALVSGTYKPTNFNLNTDTFPAPAPVAPFGATMAALTSSDPNGTWSLFVRDDERADAGSIAAGWSLSITTSNAICCSELGTVADLGIEQSVSATTVNVGGELTYTIEVRNWGPDAASGVLVLDPLPNQLILVSAGTSQGEWHTNGGAVTCSLGTMTNGASAMVTITTVAIAGGSVKNSVSVESIAMDPNPENNSSTLTVLVNELPFISVIPDQTIDEDTSTGPIGFVVGDSETPVELLTVWASSSDSELIPEAGMVIGGGESNRTLTITPAPDAFGTATITVTVDDGMGTSSTAFLLRVNPVNDPPTLAEIPDFTIYEHETLRFTSVATDPDLPGQVLTFSLETGAPTGAIIDPETGTFTWTPDESEGPSVNTITIVVIDNGDPVLSAMQTFTVTVLETNAAPVLEAIEKKTVSRGETLVVNASASDADIPANALTFTLGPGAPGGAAIDPESGVFSWTPDNEQEPGAYTITIVVTDDGEPSLSAAQSFTVTVLGLNTAPVLAPIADQMVVEGEMLVVTNSASDVDIPANVLIFSLTGDVPAGAAIDSETGTFTWTPDESQGPGTNQISIVVTDNGEPSLSATQSFTIIVLEVNSAPVISPIGDRTIYAGSAIAIMASAVDTDLPENTLTFSLDPGAPTGAHIDAATGLFSWTPGAAEAGTFHSVTIRVTDDGTPSLSDATTFAISVAAPLMIESLTVSGEIATLTWNAIPGSTYRVQFKENAADTNWTDLAPDVVATDDVASQEAPAGGSQRFYRVMLVP